CCGTAVRRWDGGRDDSEAGDDRGHIERGNAGSISASKCHGATGSERDRRGEVDGPVPEPVVGERHRRRAHSDGYGAEIAVSLRGVTDSSHLAGDQPARASIHGSGARHLLPNPRFGEEHVSPYLSRAAAEGFEN